MDDPSNRSEPPMTADHVHEESDVAIRPLATFLVSLVGALVVVALLMMWMFDWFMATTNIDLTTKPVIPVPEEEFTAPVLQVSPRRDLELFRASEAKLLNSTEWINREQGVVRIPIEQAVEIVAEKGFPNWPAAEVTPPMTEEGQSAGPHSATGGSP